MPNTDDINAVTFTGEIVEITSRAYDGRVYWTMMVLVRGSYYSRDEKHDTTNFIAVDLDQKRAEKRDEIPPGTKVRIDGTLRGNRGKQGGCFMSVRIAKMAIVEPAPQKPSESGAPIEDDEVPF